MTWSHIPTSRVWHRHARRCFCPDLSDRSSAILLPVQCLRMYPCPSSNRGTTEQSLSLVTGFVCGQAYFGAERGLQPISTLLVREVDKAEISAKICASAMKK